MKGEGDYLHLESGQLVRKGGVVFNKGLKWSISNWEVVSVWDDFWLASGPLRKQIESPSNGWGREHHC